MEALWTKRLAENFYGYKDHISVDVKHKLIRCYEVTPANVADIHCLEALLDPKNTDNKVWADELGTQSLSL